MAALALARMQPRIALPTMMIMAAPVMVPPLVVGLALMVFYVTVGLKLSVFTVILSHLVFTQPFVILIVHARMIGFDYAAVESARDLGASPLRAASKPTWSNSSPGSATWPRDLLIFLPLAASSMAFTRQAR